MGERWTGRPITGPGNEFVLAAHSLRRHGSDDNRMHSWASFMHLSTCHIILACYLFSVVVISSLDQLLLKTSTNRSSMRTMMVPFFRLCT